MILKNSMSIVSSRFGLVYKVLLFAFIIMLLVCVVAMSVLFPTLRPIINEMREIELVKDISQVIKAGFSGDVETQQSAYIELENDFLRVKQLFDVHLGNFVAGIILLILFIFVGYFLLSLSHFSVSDILYNFMNNNSKFGFTSNLFFNLRVNLRYSALMTLIAIPTYVLTIGAIWLTWLLCAKVSYWLCLPACFGVYCLISSLKCALFCDWLPNMVIDKKGVCASLRDSVKSNLKRLPGMLNVYFTFNILYAAFFVIITLATFGFGIIFAPVLRIVFNRAIELVNFHQKNDLPYYTITKNWNKAKEQN